MIVFDLAEQISIQKLSYIFIQSQYAAMKKLSARRTGIFASVFNVDFSSFPQAFSLVIQRSFLLKRRVEQEPEKPDSLMVQTSSSREK